MSLVWRVATGIDHKVRNTLLITRSGDSCEFDRAKYCVRCGDIVK